ncbi:uncharacterized protein SCDLUD_004234 [Saccharomycodes ludwigii]|uniref:uncharacterized protein n=1 Tax=Saccharomycodes ludwigii TaxID=36035 RepID=UPI001E88B219|nr:hypothetical protein SCDLUD_004234 [Saccharomycodes ludwigii]KAH3899921.1 hypothetical protein SCDLUD_004234 [Saccharomycodes ludwigii]
MTKSENNSKDSTTSTTNIPVINVSPNINATNKEKHNYFLNTVPSKSRKSSTIESEAKILFKDTINLSQKSTSINNDNEEVFSDQSDNQVDVDELPQLVTCESRTSSHSKSLTENEHFIYLKHEKYHKDKGIAGILTRPKSALTNNRKGILLLHGHSGHKDQCCLPLINAKLGSMGYYVLRIDFRGLGDSEENADPSVGRTIQQDIEDIETCYLFFRNICNVKLDAIVAHSRAVISMFQFVIDRLQPCYHDFISNLFNCSGRYVSNELITKVQEKAPNWYKDKGYYCKAYRMGKLTDVFIPMSETLSAASIDVTQFTQIDSRTFIFSIYGGKEDIMPLSYATQYADLFGSRRHKLEIIPNADHCFYGLANDPNIYGLPIRKGKVNYNYLVVNYVADFLSEENQMNLFNSMNKYIENDIYPPSFRWPLPFEYSNVSNFRDIGGYKLSDDNIKRVKSNIFYRCANPSKITKRGLEYLTETLHVRKIFDLRSDAEREKTGIIDCEKVNVVHLNFKQDMDLEDIALHYQGMLLSPLNFPQAYMIVLKKSLNCIREFFQYLLSTDLEEEGISVVFHCTAGKDRTGILCMLLLKILNVDDETICNEYSLTTIGLKTETDLIDSIMERDEQYYVNVLGEAHYNKYISKKDITPLQMNKNVLSSNYLAMRIFIEDFEKEFGGIESFFIEHLHLSMKDIELLRSRYTC